MGTKEQAGQDVERLKQRAAELGFDPERVARALNQRAPGEAEPAPERPPAAAGEEPTAAPEGGATE